MSRSGWHKRKSADGGTTAAVRVGALSTGPSRHPSQIPLLQARLSGNDQHERAVELAPHLSAEEKPGGGATASRAHEAAGNAVDLFGVRGQRTCADTWTVARASALTNFRHQ